jgi:hypothetical protein
MVYAMNWLNDWRHLVRDPILRAIAEDKREEYRNILGDYRRPDVWLISEVAREYRKRGGDVRDTQDSRLGLAWALLAIIREGWRPWELQHFGVYALIGSCRDDGPAVTLGELADNTADALRKNEPITLGFDDGGYQTSVEFIPTQIEDGDDLHPLRSTRIFTGVLNYRYIPACLIISQRGDDTDAVLMIMNSQRE